MIVCLVANKKLHLPRNMKNTITTYSFIIVLTLSLSGVGLLNQRTYHRLNSTLDSTRLVYCYTATETSMDYSFCDNRIKNLGDPNCPLNTIYNQPISSNTFYPEQYNALRENSQRTFLRFYSLLKI